MKLGLRIDVDTLRGTKTGVPNLCRTLEKYGLHASFFFSVGPDNMGRHIWRLLRPAFLVKMLRTRAASLYGWDILLKGTFWPGPLIGEKAEKAIRQASELGHEIGLHAWDHHQWQARTEMLDRDSIRSLLQKGCDEIKRITGKPPVCSAVPAWRCTDITLAEKSRFSFKYNSDCRGESIFYPLLNGERLEQPQIPTTLPTYDEIIGASGMTDYRYNETILGMLRPEKLNVLTVHAEAEGIVCNDLFDRFLRRALGRKIDIVPLGELLSETAVYPSCRIISGEMTGREGWISLQERTPA